MTSISSTNAATEARTTSDDDQRGTFFFLGKAAFTLMTLELAAVADVTSLRCVPAHASGCP